jgi:hypothetical protein
MMMFQKKFQQNHLFRPIYPSMWFNPRQLMLPEGNFFSLMISLFLFLFFRLQLCVYHAQRWTLH